MSTDRRTELADFLESEILGGRTRPGFEDDLLLSGLIDSINMMVVLDWIGDTTGFSVPMEDVTIDNFASIDSIATYLEGAMPAAVAKTVWVLEDDGVFGPAVCRAIERAGYATERFPTLRSLLEAPGTPDLAVVDLRLPDGSGIDAVRHLVPVPVIVLTGHGSIPDAVETMRVGGFDFLTKPVSTDRLIGALTAAGQATPASEADRAKMLAALDTLR